MLFTPGNLDRILEGQEDAFAGALLGVHVEQVLAAVDDFAAGDLVAVAPGEDAGQRALAGAVRPHDGVDFAGVDGEVDAFEDLPALDAGGEVSDGEDGLLGHGWGRIEIRHSSYGASAVPVISPTLPSRLTPRSFCASTANSIGSSLNTSLQKPFTIMLTASCVAMPRWLQ